MFFDMVSRNKYTETRIFTYYHADRVALSSEKNFSVLKDC